MRERIADSVFSGTRECPWGRLGRSALTASALACIAALVALPAASAESAADPGVTAASIHLGTTGPTTGVGAAVARGARAYFAHVGARGGVAGRTFELTTADDGGDPAATEDATRQLVEEEEVFAVVSPAGTEQSLAARGYLNIQKVPQLFTASGATTWGRDRRTFPWSIGFQPSCQAEGWIYGRYFARTLARSRVAVLYEDGVDGRDLLRGLGSGLAGSASRVVASESLEPTATSVHQEVARLRAARADVLAVFATPRLATRAYASLARLRWNPRVLAGAQAASAGGTPRGAISLAFLKDPADPQWKDDPGMRLYRALMKRHARGANVSDVQHVHGMAVAYETVSLFERAGGTPTRAKLMSRARSITSAGNPFLLPGVTVRTSATDGFPVQQGRLRRFTGRRWVSFGGLWSAS
jgi:branched-chain amino acid transport system substrate-binding protein